MRRIVVFTILMLSVLAASDALAICQKCTADGTPDAMCVVVGSCGQQAALYAACWEQQFFNPDGSLKYEKCVGSPAGPECKQSCPPPPGGGGNPGGGTGGGGCRMTPAGCPAECTSCGSLIDEE